MMEKRYSVGFLLVSLKIPLCIGKRMEGVFVWNLFLLHDSRTRISMILSCHAQKTESVQLLYGKYRIDVEVWQYT